MKNEIEKNLFNRVDNILSIAHKNIVTSVNINMVIAYWLIGREIVIELQSGKKRAAYGKLIIENLSLKLNEKYKKGFSVRNLQYFRKFYTVFSDRISIPHPLGAEFKEFNHLYDNYKNNNDLPISHPMGAEFKGVNKHSFSPQLSWSHYRALLKVEESKARQFYEEEAIACGWNKRNLERQIQSSYYQRILKSQNPQKILDSARNEIVVESNNNINFLKNPYVLEFLNLSEVAKLQETHLETAIINHLQSFLLELGKGFAFVARQKKMLYNDKELYVDLVFYNSILKCYLLIDLKMGELSHRDVGQMESYVRMYDDLFIAEDDKPSIGLILCSERNETIVKYSVLADIEQIFASKYMLYLPTEEELKIEIEREIKLIENNNDNCLL